MKTCVVCSRPPVGLLFCRLCGLSYDRAIDKDNTLATIIIWASRRARGMERRRLMGPEVPRRST